MRRRCATSTSCDASRPDQTPPHDHHLAGAVGDLPHPQPAPAGRCGTRLGGDPPTAAGAGDAVDDRVLRRRDEGAGEVRRVLAGQRLRRADPLPTVPRAVA